VLGALLAAAASAGLAWWFGAPHESAPAPVIAPPSAASRPIRTAAAQADEAQVRRAYDAFQNAYADNGAAGVAAARKSCAATLSGDPRILDYCLAFDMFAGAVLSDAPAARLDAQRLAAARAALPAGADPARRIAEVGRLAKAVALGDTPATQPGVQTAAQPSASPRAPAPAKPVRLAKAPALKASGLKARPNTHRAAPARPAIDPCLFEPTAADRLLCANPSLAEADRRMRRAYDEALGSVADRRQVEDDQARWRAQRDRASDPAQVQELYDARTRDLEDLTPPH
jgi:uncharacterized protein YecT (DUF1311 family)